MKLKVSPQRRYTLPRNKRLTNSSEKSSTQENNAAKTSADLAGLNGIFEETEPQVNAEQGAKTERTVSILL